MLNDYIPVVGKSIIDELTLLAEKLSGTSIQTVNSTRVGGGVAEILNRMIPLFKEMGVDISWNTISGDDRFFAVTKKIHNTLHGRIDVISRDEWNIYNEIIERNLSKMNLNNDIIFVHDPQPLGLVKKKNGNRWIWRCHIDLSNPDRQVWKNLKQYVDLYDATVFSAPSFSRDLNIPQVLIPPSIDPLSDKCREITTETIRDILHRLAIDPEIPIITQISRFDRLKDPIGVIEAFKLAQKYVDCQLVLAGGSADDDPEGNEVLAQVRERAAGDPQIHIMVLPPDSHLEINALQRASAIIIQKSLKEGFALTVSEALWKGKPVIASAVGGIPLQITHKYSGILTHTIEGTAFWIKQLVQAPDFARKLGENGREHVKQNFLLTRHLRDYLTLFLSLYYPDDVVYI